MTASYAALVRRRSARRLIYALSAASLSFGMVALTVLLTVHAATGSYPVSGYAVGALALAAGLSAPFRGRFVDRRGARIALPALATGFATSLVVLDIAAHRHGSAALLICLGAAIGVSTPPLFASARVVWPQAVDATLLRRGYAVTALLGDVGQVAGPALASLLFLVSGWIGPIVCAVACLAGAGLSLPTRAPGRFTNAPEPMPRLFASRGLPGVLAVSIALGAGLGLVQVAVPTVAGRWHQASLGGPLLAAFGFGSVLGAVWYGSRSWRQPVLDRYLCAVAAIGVLLSPAVVAGSPAAIAPVLVVAGLAFGPATVALFESLDALVPGSGAEALAWVTTAEASGQAGGSALAAVLAGRVTTWAPFALAAVLFAVPAGAALAFRTWVRR